MTGPQHAHAGLDGLVMGDAFGDSWFTRSDENAEEQWAAGRCVRNRGCGRTIPPWRSSCSRT